MEHEKFVAGYKSGAVEADIDTHAAGFLFEKEGLIPQRLRKKQVNIRTSMFGLSILGIVLFFFVKWYFALAVLTFGLALSNKATSAAGQAVLETALDSPAFYQMMVEKGILKVRAKGQST